MAKSSKSSNNLSDKTSAIDESADDAVVVPSDDAPSGKDAETQSVNDSEDASKETDATAANTPDETGKPDTEDDHLEQDDDPKSDDADTPEDTSDGNLAVVPTTRPEPTHSSGAGALSLVAGGIVAGAIGYIIGTYHPFTGTQDQSALAQQVEEQSAQIASLEDRLDTLPAPDFSEVESAIADIQGSTGDQISGIEQALADQIEAFDARISELEMQPNADGTLSETALEAYRAELDELRQELNAQQENVMSAAAQAEADLAAARAEAETLEQQAVAAAEAAAARAALNRISTAVETGAPFADALADLNAAEVPQALTAAADEGVATRAELASQFPEVARAALATARAEGVSGDAGGIGGFFRSQFDVRSTAPREGSDPDAVLSRAEAAVREGRIADALAEIEALPEVARAEMTEWTAAAQERADVLNAVATLSETYN